MNKLDAYSIEFLGLKVGKHEFSFHVNKNLFLSFENEEIEDANINVTVYLEKNIRYLELNFKIIGSIQTTCDRCLEGLTINIDYSPTLHVNFGDYTSDLTDIDDVMTLSRAEDKLELSKHLYDYIMLNLPIQRTHCEANGEECNPEMIEQIQKYEIGNNNFDKNETDPRWDKLKHLYN